MSIFGSILSAITGAAQKTADQSGPAQEATTTPDQQPDQPAQPTQQTPAIDIQQVLSNMAAQKGGQLNWQSSIVDLLKLVGVDSSLQHRQELAHELGYTGDTSNTTEMNEWLHKAVMQQLEEHGGKLEA